MEKARTENRPEKMKRDTDTTNNISINKGVVVFCVILIIAVLAVCVLAAVGIWKIGELENLTSRQQATIATLSSELMSLSAEVDRLASETARNSCPTPDDFSTDLRTNSTIEEVMSLVNGLMRVNNTLTSQLNQLHHQVEENSNGITRVNSTLRQDVEQLAIASHTNNSQLRTDIERIYLQLRGTIERNYSELRDAVEINFSQLRDETERKYFELRDATERPFHSANNALTNISVNFTQLELATSQNFTSITEELYSIATKLAIKVEAQSARHRQDIEALQREDSRLWRDINSAGVAKQLITTTLLFSAVAINLVCF